MAPEDMQYAVPSESTGNETSMFDLSVGISFRLA